jgi:SsrA-binding protein
MSIVDNKKAYHDYFVEEKFEAGIALEGWEVKAIRAGRAQIKEAYVVVKNGEIVLLGAHVTPLPTASTHIRPDPTRNRKLLLHRPELNRLSGKVERGRLTPLNLHFTKGRIKIEIGLARAKAIRQAGGGQGTRMGASGSGRCATVQRRASRGRRASRCCDATTGTWRRSPRSTASRLRRAARASVRSPGVGSTALRGVDGGGLPLVRRR